MPVNKWLTIFKDKTIADALLDCSVFIKDNFQLGVDNTINQIKAFESTSTDVFDKIKLIYDTYESIYSLYEYLERYIIPLHGPKDAWIWEPNLSNNYLADFANSSENAINVRLNEVKSLLDKGKIQDARDLLVLIDKFIPGTNRNEVFLTISSNLDESAKNIAIEFTNKMISDNNNKEAIIDSTYLISAIKKYNPKDSDLTSLKDKCIDALIHIYLNEGYEVEVKCDVDSLIEAIKTYKLGV